MIHNNHIKESIRFFETCKKNEKEAYKMADDLKHWLYYSNRSKYDNADECIVNRFFQVQRQLVPTKLQK